MSAAVRPAVELLRLAQRIQDADESLHFACPAD
jgi:hypothetical protein